MAGARGGLAVEVERHEGDPLLCSVGFDGQVIAADRGLGLASPWHVGDLSKAAADRENHITRIG
jgi:hypothetical protein